MTLARYYDNVHPCANHMYSLLNDEPIEMRLAFFGSDRFSTLCLDKFLKLNVGRRVVDTEGFKVYCPPQGKGELLQYCLKNNLTHTLLPPKTLREWQLDGKFDIGLVASFGYFIPGRIISAFKKGLLNAHPSLLPKYRGASPLQYTIMRGDKETGVSIIDVDPKEFDVGKMWAQESVNIDSFPDFNTLEYELAIKSGDLFYNVLSNYNDSFAGKRAQEGQITFAPKITRKDAEIVFGEMSAMQVFGRYQALRHQEYIHGNLVNGSEVGLLEILDPRTNTPLMDPQQFREMSLSTPVGGTFWERKSKIIWIKCADSSWLGVKRFRLQGKSSDFDSGNFYNATKLVNFTNKSFS